MIRRGRIVVLCVLLVIAGCAGPQPSSDPADGTSATATVARPSSPLSPSSASSPPPASTTRRDCPNVLLVTNESRVSIDEAIAYENLSRERRREFRAALENGTVEFDETVPSTWRSPAAISYRGETYYGAVPVCE